MNPHKLNNNDPIITTIIAKINRSLPDSRDFQFHRSISPNITNTDSPRMSVDLGTLKN